MRDMKDLRNQPVEDLSPASFILLRKFLMPEHSNNHPLQVGRPRGRWLPVWAPLLLQLCPPSHCVLPMTPQNQRGTHTHTRVRSMGAVSALGVKNRIYLHGAACAALAGCGWAHPCHLQWEDTAPCDAGFTTLGLCLILDLSVLNLSPWLGVWSCL